VKREGECPVFELNLIEDRAIARKQKRIVIAVSSVLILLSVMISYTLFAQYEVTTTKRTADQIALKETEDRIAKGNSTLAN